ncbi:MAG: WD40 repeat domain-containing protein [Acidobacteriota bacterium]
MKRSPGSPAAAVALAWVGGLLGALIVVGSLEATETKVLRVQSASAFVAGRLEGVALDPLGALLLADRMDKLAGIDEPFLFSAARLPDGWVVGTGNSGRVLKVDEHGKVTVLFQAPEAVVFALWSDPDGTVFAGTSPKGKVYRIPPGGKGAVFFDPQEIYIWSLARGADGGLLVATGTQGKLYRVDSTGSGKVLYDAADTHLRALLALPSGDVLVGTASQGLVQRVSKDGTARTLFDAGGREVVAFTAAPDGTMYAAVASSESGLPEADLLAMQAQAMQQQVQGSAGPGGAPGATGGPGSATVTVTPQDGAAKTSRSEVFRISPSGVVESVWAFTDDTVYSMVWARGRLWVGTGLEGKIFSYNAASARMVLEKDADERQIMALWIEPASQRLMYAATNAAALYRSTGESERHGTYTSPALDAAQVARFGVLRWRGDLPRGATARFSVRTGVSAEPDRTWSAWSEGSSEREISLADLPPARYLQWRVELGSAGDASPRITAVEASFRHLNLRPRLTKFVALDPGEVVVPANFNPGAQIFEPTHAAKDGMFTTLQPATGVSDASKTVWKKGYRTLRWEASDANDDTLSYTLEFRREGNAEGFLPMAQELVDTWYSFDETALPDGAYRFRLRASDRKGNPDEALEAEQVSEPVVVDATPPRLASVAWEGKRIRVIVEDALNPVRSAEVSLDGGMWRPARAVDGLLDGRREALVIDLPTPPRLVVLRVMDAAYNVATFELPTKGESQ